MSETRRQRPTQAELKTVFGYDEGRLVHVSEVVEANRRSLRCVRCDGPLVARLGKKYRHHFGHMATCECDGGRETAIHVFSKEALLRGRCLTLPECVASVPTLGLLYTEFPIKASIHSWSGGMYRQVIKPSQVVTFDDVSLEVVHDGFRPDAVATMRGRAMAVEFANTHFTGPDKVTLIMNVNISAVEVDVSDPPLDLPPQDLERWVLHDAPRKWLHNGRAVAWEEGLTREVNAIVDAKRKVEIYKADQERKFAAKREAAVNKARADIVRGLATEVDPALDRVPDDVRERIGSNRLSWAVNWAPPYKTFFCVRPEVWQSHVLSELIGKREEAREQGFMVSHRDIAQHLVDLQIAPKSLHYIHLENRQFARELVPDFVRPEEVVGRYLQLLVFLGVAQCSESLYNLAINGHSERLVQADWDEKGDLIRSLRNLLINGHEQDKEIYSEVIQFMEEAGFGSFIGFPTIGSNVMRVEERAWQSCFLDVITNCSMRALALSGDAQPWVDVAYIDKELLARGCISPSLLPMKPRDLKIALIIRDDFVEPYRVVRNYITFLVAMAVIEYNYDGQSLERVRMRRSHMIRRSSMVDLKQGCVV